MSPEFPLLAATFEGRPSLKKLRFRGVCWFTSGVGDAFDVRLCAKPRGAIAASEGAWTAVTYSAAPPADPNACAGYELDLVLPLGGDFSGRCVAWVEVQQTAGAPAQISCEEHCLYLTS